MFNFWEDTVLEDGDEEDIALHVACTLESWINWYCKGETNATEAA